MKLKDAFWRDLRVASIAIAAGFLGSVIHDWMPNRHQIIRAKRFEGINESGTLVSFWGPDENPQIPKETPRGVLLVFIDPSGVRRCQIGSRIGDFGPELEFYDKFGPSAAGPQKYLAPPRFAISLHDFEDPEMVFRSRDAWRITLGATHGDMPDSASVEVRHRKPLSLGTKPISGNTDLAYLYTMGRNRGACRRIFNRDGTVLRVPRQHLDQ